MRVPRRALRTVVLALALAVAGVAPATAEAAAAWKAVSAGAGASVDFRAVATYRPPGQTTDVVVAVGQDTSTHEAAIFRLVAGSWQRDPIAQVPAGSRLTAVALTRDAAWAVGDKAGTGEDESPCEACEPFVVRFAGGGAELARAPDPGAETPPSWIQLPVDKTSGPLTSVVLSGDDGFLGSARGDVHRIEDGAIGGSLAYTPFATRPTAVNGLALPAAEHGFAVGDSSLPSGGRIFELSAGGAQAAGFQPNPAPAAALRAVAAVPGAAGQPSPALAIEPAAYWLPDAAGIWRREQPSPAFSDPSNDLRAVAMLREGATITSAIAGSASGQPGQEGAVWIRSGTANSGSWTPYQRLGPPLRGVAVAGREDVWAVGGGGAVLHFAPVLSDDDGGDGGDTGTDGDTGTGGRTGSDRAAGGPAGGSSKGGNDIPTQVIVKPPPRRRPGSKPRAPKPRRMVRDLRVRVGRGRVFISFRLLARARVGARAMSGRRTVGRLKARLMRPGNRRLIVRYRGRKPPTKLQIIVRPTTRAAASRWSAPQRENRRHARR
jgi:hypothetical protein